MPGERALSRRQQPGPRARRGRARSNRGSGDRRRTARQARARPASGPPVRSRPRYRARCSVVSDARIGASVADAERRAIANDVLADCVRQWRETARRRQCTDGALEMLAGVVDDRQPGDRRVDQAACHPGEPVELFLGTLREQTALTDSRKPIFVENISRHVRVPREARAQRAHRQAIDGGRRTLSSKRAEGARNVDSWELRTRESRGRGMIPGSCGAARSAG
jgi:hypothetical protein